jgi:hypothetical protein
LNTLVIVCTANSQPHPCSFIPQLESCASQRALLGEVILFAADAVNTMGKDGLFVLLEGREQTVNYVRTPYRFTLVLSDESLIGKRRAAQRVMAAALKMVPENATDEEVGKALDACLEEMAKEVN